MEVHVAARLRADSVVWLLEAVRCPVRLGRVSLTVSGTAGAQTIR